jgi:hypothetical protein
MSRAQRALGQPIFEKIAAPAVGEGRIPDTNVVGILPLTPFYMVSGLLQLPHL